MSILQKREIPNVGWLFLGLLIILCLVGAIISFFSASPSDTYLDFILQITDALFSLLSIINPILEFIGTFPVLSEIPLIKDILGFIGSLHFEPIFGTSGRNLLTFRGLANGALVTLQLSVSSIILGFIIAVFLAVITSLRHSGILYGLARVYIDFFRSTPLLVQMLIFYLGLPQPIQAIGSINLFIVSIDLSRFNFSPYNAALIALSLNTAAYQAEIIRAGIQAIPTGQTEASRGLGMTTPQTMQYVILPQALRIIIPPFTNEAINVILNSSLATVLSVFELTRIATNLSSFYFNTFDVFLTAALFYFVIAYTLANLAKKFEVKYRIPGLGVAKTD